MSTHLLFFTRILDALELASSGFVGVFNARGLLASRISFVLEFWFGGSCIGHCVFWLRWKLISTVRWTIRTNSWLLGHL